MAGVVLIVDEDLSLLKRLHAFLREKKVDCYATRRTDTALAAFAVADVDLVVADREVCAKKGWELGRALREVTATPIVMTCEAGLDDELGDKGLLDACAVLRKPYDERDFWAVIYPILGGLGRRVRVS